MEWLKFLLSGAVGVVSTVLVFVSAQSKTKVQSIDFQNDFIEQLRTENKDLRERLDKISAQMQDVQDENTQMRIQLAEIMVILKQNNINYPQGGLKK